MEYAGHRTLFGDRCMSESLESHSSGSASLRLAADGSPNGHSSTTCGSSSSVISVDDVVACPSSLHPVRIVCEENSSSKRSKKRHVQHLPAVAQQQHRSSCMFSMYQTVLTCWSDWTADPNFTSRFFFQDSRPRVPNSSPGWPTHRDWFDAASVDKS